MKLVIGTRGSKLALAQAGQLGGSLSALSDGLEVHLEVIKTLGDGLSADPGILAIPADAPQGIFTRELDEALDRLPLTPQQTALVGLSALHTAHLASLAIREVLERAG